MSVTNGETTYRGAPAAVVVEAKAVANSATLAVSICYAVKLSRLGTSCVLA